MEQRGTPAPLKHTAKCTRRIMRQIGEIYVVSKVMSRNKGGGKRGKKEAEGRIEILGGNTQRGPAHESDFLRRSKT